MAELAAAEVGVEALELWVEARPAEVPLADEGGGVAGFVKRFSEGEFFERQLVEVRGGEELPGATAGDPVGEVQAGGVLACELRGARGRTDRAGGVGRGQEPELRCGPIV